MKTIPGFPPHFLIDQDGSVYSAKRGFNHRLAMYIGSNGYPAVGLKINGKTVVCSVHRLLALAYIPNPCNRPQVNHIDGNKLNFSLSNLEWCTDSENKFHAHRTGLMQFTEKAKAASMQNVKRAQQARRRFSDVEESAIAQRIASGEGYRAIARSLGCDHTLIIRIARISKQHRSAA